MKKEEQEILNTLTEVGINISKLVTLMQNKFNPGKSEHPPMVGYPEEPMPSWVINEELPVDMRKAVINMWGIGGPEMGTIVNSVEGLCLIYNVPTWDGVDESQYEAFILESKRSIRFDLMDFWPLNQIEKEHLTDFINKTKGGTANHPLF